MNRLSSVWKSILIVLLGFIFALALLFVFKMVLAWTNPTQAPPGGSGSGIIPAGTVMPYSGGSVPTGWLLADGSAVSRTTYSALFNVVGTTYGVGDGSTTFNLPDLRGRVVAGKGTNANVDTLGDNENAALGNRSPSHSHGIKAYLLTMSGAAEVGAGNLNGQQYGPFNSTGNPNLRDMPAYFTLNYIIKY